MMGRHVIRALMSMAVLLGASGCSLGARADDPGRLVIPGDGGEFGAIIDEVAADQPFTFGSIPVCAEGEDPATISAVDPIRAEGLEVVGFSVRPVSNETYFGAEPIDLRTAGFDPESHEVSATCEHPAELGLELRRSTGITGTAEGFTLTYQAPDGTADVVLPFQPVLCAPEDTVTPDC